ncbi:hypothetical protein IE81DRAFT_319856 [Ceraceosorus guamensis]|uniref:Thioesterase domain-containing protein n=1 Tax=Ceraceosorus guamensis TaxID=1522189 RepID=A0A316W6Z5_9BASI|nr:hypothetical protein IE81DRAFT_319856 [Ceraceosorus guamensis]PWN45572.1 hypothetical protein IE81DRAFT_319856 [Ceraceosorus guamensis]
MRYGEVLASRLTSQRAQDIVKGTGKGMILAKISVKYIRPVTYPDTLLIGTRPVLPLQGSDRFTLQANIVSLKQQALVATADQLCVSYDYPALTKCDLPRDLKDEIEKSGAGAGAGAAP